MNAITQLRPSFEPLDPHLLRSALESAPGSFAVVENGILLYANPAFAHIFGSAADLRGRALSEFIPEISPLTPACGKDVAGAKCGYPALEFHHTLPDGTGIHL